MQSCVGLGLCNELMQAIALGDVEFMKSIGSVAFQICQRARIARVREGIDVADSVALADKESDQVRTDKA